MRAVTALALAWTLGASPAFALEILYVQATPRHFDPARGEEIAISFRLTEPAPVIVRIYDGRDLEIRKIETGPLEVGDHQIRWDGHDFAGRPVPPEAYRYTLEALLPSGSPPVVWDPSDLTGGETLRVERTQWDPAAGVVRYQLPEPARVRIRIGLRDGGPLLRTLLDWVPRDAGVHEEPWDGLDASGILELAHHPRLSFQPEAFSLPQNAILVDPPPEHVTLITDLPPEPGRRPAAPARSRRMLDFARQPLESRSDFPLKLDLVERGDRSPDGLPIVRGSSGVRVDLDRAETRALLGERFEVVFFIDGQFVFENETGFLPMTWIWDTGAVNPGPHYVTANLRGYEGHFGLATLEVWVARDGAAGAANHPSAKEAE
jgi:FlgD Ig-like domain